MKVLVVGFPTPNPDIENYTPLTAPSYYDYDALVVDPESITRVAQELLAGERDFQAPDGRTVVNAASTASAVSAGELMQRRADETAKVLESGGTVVVFARPNAPVTGIIGFEGADRYSWLPAPAGASWAPPFLKAADGKNIRIKDDSHPVSHLLREFRRHFAFRAAFDDRLESYRKNAHTIAEAGAGVPIAAQFPVLAGRVIFMPALKLPTGTPRQKFGIALVEACVRLSGAEANPTPPAWTRSLAVPGLEQVEAELEDARRASDEANQRLREVSERRDDLAAHRQLLWATGHQFESAVRNALLLLGFNLESQPREPLKFSADGQEFYVEAEASDDAVVEWPYIRLQRRLEEYMIRLRKTAKGIIVVSGKRGEAPDKRKSQFSEPLRIASENYGYALVTGETLFQMVMRAIAGAEPSELESMRLRLVRARGLLDSATALGETSEAPESGPIF